MQFRKSGFYGLIAIIACVACVCIITAADYASSAKEFVLSAVPVVGLFHLYSGIHHILIISENSNSSELHEIILKSLYYKG